MESLTQMTEASRSLAISQSIKPGGSMNLRWIPHIGTSALHAAEASWRGDTIVDAQLAEAVREPAAELARRITTYGLPELRMWRNLGALIPTFDTRRQAVKIAGLRAKGSALSEIAVAAIAGAITDVEKAVTTAFPGLHEELELRGRVLREQWEARGPGMLARVQQLLPDDVLLQGSDVLLVQPALGGDGKANLVNNTVRIEAMLANPHPKLPEVVRLAWLLSQLNLDVPKFSENIHPDRLPHITALAMLPVALEAAHYVELVTFDRELLPLAIDAWRLRVPADANPAELIANWWVTYQEAKPTLAVALQALDEMFG
jgi:hypothetical protein